MLKAAVSMVEFPVMVRYLSPKEKPEGGKQEHRSVTSDSHQENSEIFDFELHEQEMFASGILCFRFRVGPIVF